MSAVREFEVLRWAKFISTTKPVGAAKSAGVDHRARPMNRGPYRGPYYSYYTLLPTRPSLPDLFLWKFFHAQIAGVCWVWFHCGLESAKIPPGNNTMKVISLLLHIIRRRSWLKKKATDYRFSTLWPINSVYFLF